MAFNDFATTWPTRNARLAYCLSTLSDEIAIRYPQATFLGAIGDTAHQSEGAASDHNPIVIGPDGKGIVRALDVGGPDDMLKELRQHLWAWYANQDPRLYYYGYAKGCSDNLVNGWGTPLTVHLDPGDAGHLHISVTQTQYPSIPGGYVAAIDSTAPWGLLEDDVSAAEVWGTQVTVPTEWAPPGGQQQPAAYVLSQTLSLVTVLYDAFKAGGSLVDYDKLAAAIVAKLPAPTSGGLTKADVVAALTETIKIGA